MDEGRVRLVRGDDELLLKMKTEISLVACYYTIYWIDSISRSTVLRLEMFEMNILKYFN